MIERVDGPIGVELTLQPRHLAARPEPDPLQWPCHHPQAVNQASGSSSPTEY